MNNLWLPFIIHLVNIRIARIFQPSPKASSSISLRRDRTARLGGPTCRVFLPLGLVTHRSLEANFSAINTGMNELVIEVDDSVLEVASSLESKGN